MSINNFDVAVFLHSKLWLEFADEDKIKDIIIDIAKKIIKLSPIFDFIDKKQVVAFEISLLSNYQIRKINKDFRGKDKATNTISLAILDKEINKFGLEEISKASQYIFLGEIFLGFETIKKEAKLENKEFINHLTHLILHSILHLIGFDHIKKNEAEIMEKLEISILKKLNIINPYQNIIF